MVLWSCIHGYSQMVTAAAAHNPAVLNAKGPEGVTPLMLACQYGHLALINTLLELVRGVVWQLAGACEPPGSHSWCGVVWCGVVGSPGR